MVFGPSICSAEVPASIARKFQGSGQQLQRRSVIHFNQQTTCFGKKIQGEAHIHFNQQRPASAQSSNNK